MTPGEKRFGENFCPGILHAIPAKDGLLLRIRIPGGLIEPHQLRAIADLSHSFADGDVEITSRANLQLRGIQHRDLSYIVPTLSSAGLLPSPLHDRVRNIVTSPVAGLDPEELTDPRPLIHQLDRQLQADTAFLNLHPKFSFAIYGGPRRFSRDLDDLSLQAAHLNPAPDFHLSIAGASTGFLVKQEHAVDCLLTAAKLCIELALECSTPVRAKALAALPGAWQRILAGLSHTLQPSPLQPPASALSEAPLGICPTLQPDRISIIPSVPLGRLNAAQARCLAETSSRWQGDLRLAPWRGIVLGSIPTSAADQVLRQLRAIGLPCEGQDGFHGIAACAGITGCDASLADVRAHAASLAQRLSHRTAPPGWTVNLSGCDKQCARRNGATADLVATLSGYTIRIAGRPVAFGSSSDSALDTVSTLHETLLSEVAAR